VREADRGDARVVDLAAREARILGEGPQLFPVATRLVQQQQAAGRLLPGIDLIERRSEWRRARPERAFVPRRVETLRMNQDIRIDGDHRSPSPP